MLPGIMGLCHTGVSIVHLSRFVQAEIVTLCRQSHRSELVSVGHVSPRPLNVPHSAVTGRKPKEIGHNRREDMLHPPAEATGFVVGFM
jgi:hypothetical protein